MYKTVIKYKPKGQIKGKDKINQDEFQEETINAALRKNKELFH